jgi:hypothetical protein
MTTTVLIIMAVLALAIALFVVRAVPGSVLISRSAASGSSLAPKRKKPQRLRSPRAKPLPEPC